MKKVTTIGSALVDVFIKSQSFVLDKSYDVSLTCSSMGGKLEVEHFALRTGGGGSNTAVGFSRLGFETTCISETGKDNLAKLVLEDLQKDGVDTSAVVGEKKEETGGSVILVCGGGDRMVLVHRGAASHLDPHDVKEENIIGQDWLHLTNLSGRIDTVQHILELSGQHQVSMSWNPGKAALEVLANGALSLDLLGPIEILLLNNEEWMTVESIHDQLKERIPQIVVTDSDRGGVVIKNGSESSYKAVKADKVIDTTGAGDAFGVGFVSAHLAGKDHQTKIDWATRNASSVVKYFGAKEGLLTPDILK